MTWYSAHIIMFVEFKSGAQERFPVWENIVLINARTEDEAFEKAERHGRSNEGDDDDSFRWGRRPARWVFAGVRKLTECVDPLERPDDGTEVSYTELELDSLAAVKKLAAGKPVHVRINEQYRTTEPKALEAKREPKPTKRKLA